MKIRETCFFPVFLSPIQFHIVSKKLQIEAHLFTWIRFNYKKN